MALALFPGILPNIMVIFIIWIVFIGLEQKPSLNYIKSMWK